ncbi:MAG: inorganic phosphate transporter PitA [Symbiopectobacterium sp.]|uniref:inorganic phosphate transporter PitA n=1 Tax=Symbiopectobacterium sp. TaxID=2952789 RepID=UPI003F319229
MLHLFTGVDFHTGLMLILALVFVLFYEAINGFHDTANAVATVIYTRAMRAEYAVVMAGLFNFFGVMLGGLSVAYAIVHLLPTDLLLNVSSAHDLAMVFSMLLAAIIWNLGTWYFGLPASSSHTLIGSIIGIGLTNALLTNTSVVDAFNVPKMISIFLSLILSPILGMVVAGLMLFVLLRFWNNNKKRKPPFWTRTALIISAIGVSFSHGANDGQKGIGLIMLVLIGVAPAGFVVNMSASGYEISRTRDAVVNLQEFYQQHGDALKHVIDLSTPVPVTETVLPANGVKEFHCDSSRIMIAIERSLGLMNNLKSYNQLNAEDRGRVRRLLMCIADTIDKVAKLPETTSEDRRYLNNLLQDMLKTVEYAPLWIIVAVALALSLGTMVGWRRVAVTIGEKIGKRGMTYAQGVSAQVTAALSIGVASYTGMPVSTTHVLSSAVAGTMIVDGGGVQGKTVKNILLAWVFTLPVSLVMSGVLYWLALKLI